MNFRPASCLVFLACSKSMTAAAPPSPTLPPAPTVAASSALTPAPTVASSSPSGAVPVLAISDPTAKAPVSLTAKAVPLPGATAPVTLDYIAYEAAHMRIWLPVAETGSVDAFNIGLGTFVRVDGFKTVEREAGGKRRILGPSAVAVGNGFVYVGNRATNEVCPVDENSLKKGVCITLTSATDGVAYVATEKEVWVTTPKTQSIAVLDASKPETLSVKTTIRLDGAPEGYALDSAQSLFLTNLEDKDQTMGIDVKTHAPTRVWKAGCGSNGPRGIAVDVTYGFVFVACTDRVNVLDGHKGGLQVASIDTGAGVDNIDWLDSRRLLYVGAAKSARLTVARIDSRGQPTIVATAASAQGVRNGVADGSGDVYLADPAGAHLLVFRLPSL